MNKRVRRNQVSESWEKLGYPIIPATRGQKSNTASCSVYLVKRSFAIRRVLPRTQVRRPFDQIPIGLNLLAGTDFLCRFTLSGQVF
jgi:hypothetical protein